MSGNGEIHGPPEFEQTKELTADQAAADHLTSNARDLAYKGGESKLELAAAESTEADGDAAIGAGILANWARTSKLFDGAANAAALQNYKDRLDPQFVVALEWAQQDPEAVRKFLGNMQARALG